MILSVSLLLKPKLLTNPPTLPYPVIFVKQILLATTFQQCVKRIDQMLPLTLSVGRQRRAAKMSESQSVSETTTFSLDTVPGLITTKAEQKQKNERSPLHHWNGCINAPEGVLADATVFTNTDVCQTEAGTGRSAAAAGV